ncbi:TNFR/NGFR cysteine-rich region family protein [Infundibulicybe gibba]|nr:TNFR/NGFR cysteine-rich region family protein [Infundibulicybe gibba]
MPPGILKRYHWCHHISTRRIHPIHLLPGQYTSTTSPQLLHNVLTASSVSISSSAGFGNASTATLPLNLALQPGLATYSSNLYAGQSAFAALPNKPISNSTSPLSAKSFALSSSVWVAANAGTNRVIFWDSVPDVAQLPASSSGSLALVDIQSLACSPSCSGSGVCSSAGVCQCAPGFNGSSCEACSPGFFGPSCQACPSGCTSCDDGISGSGRCLKPVIANAPSTCNCLNGVCGSNGQCTCNAGFTNTGGGVACSKCSPGFFLTSTGDCQVCQLGCTQCADGTGACTTCKSGFSQDANDKTKCNAPKSVTSTGTVCPDGSFSGGTSCSPCSSTCSTCTAGTSNDCVVCATGRYALNGTCVGTNSDGVCEGSNLIADNNKRQCDSCGSKCTSCKIPNFNAASTINQLQCTACLPGSVLSNGKCIDSCPAGTFVSPQDNFTCIACDSSCGTCAGSPTFCLTCSQNQLAADGKCVSSCPSNTFSSSGSCLGCHPDCATCSGGSFNQCSSCPPDRPVLNNGRCLPTCSRSQFFDTTSSSCQTCDSSCSSCSGAGPSNCLACSSSSQVLRGGTCVSANCQQASSVVPGLGACLSELVVVPASTADTPTPLPTISGLTTPTNTTVRRPLEWWQILLMALGCAFIFLVIVWLFRRRARKQRAKRTAMFASAKALDRTGGWRWRLVRFGEKLFGHTPSRRVVISAPLESESVQLTKLRAAEEARHEEDMVKFIASYRDERPETPAASRYHTHHHRVPADAHSISESSQLSAPSIYSQMTGMPRRAPEPRQPLRKDLPSRFSASTLSSSEYLQAQHAHSSKNPFWK